MALFVVLNGGIVMLLDMGRMLIYIYIYKMGGKYPFIDIVHI